MFCNFVRTVQFKFLSSPKKSFFSLCSEAGLCSLGWSAAPYGVKDNLRPPVFVPLVVLPYCTCLICSVGGVFGFGGSVSLGSSGWPQILILCFCFLSGVCPIQDSSIYKAQTSSTIWGGLVRKIEGILIMAVNTLERKQVNGGSLDEKPSPAWPRLLINWILRAPLEPFMKWL